MSNFFLEGGTHLKFKLLERGTRQRRSLSGRAISGNFGHVWANDELLIRNDGYN